MKHIHHIFIWVCLSLFCFAGVNERVQARPDRSGDEIVEGDKQEFRGVWVQTVFQDRYRNMSPDECKQYLTRLVDRLYQTGFNAVIFQVRPEGDAFYRSDLEPWSRFLTGVQGKAPVPQWDPMEYLIQLCHARQMEFHAWLNPYRMSASKTLKMGRNHLYFRHPEWFVRHGDKLYLNPGLPEARQHIREVVKDIVGRYDVDAIHMDDYFYPYPSGEPFNDREAFRTYGEMMGFNPDVADDLSGWRRRNVNILIKTLNADIKRIKPWVRFGISPFGIYRHHTSWRGGSRTRGLQCFDDLYADVLLWCREGWIDYVVPQIYWEIGHSLADYTILVKWWNANVPERCHLYIGQSIERSLDDPKDSTPLPDLRTSHVHFSKKLNLARGCKNVKGNCFWYAYQVDDDLYHVRDFLKNELFTAPALPPAYGALDEEVPGKVKKLRADFTGKGLKVAWRRAETNDYRQQERYYCVYKFRKGERVDLKDMTHLFLRTPKTEFYDEDIEGSRKFTYVVTAVDVFNNEGKPAKKTIRVKIK